MQTAIVVSDEKESELSVLTTAISERMKYFLVVRDDSHRDEAIEFCQEAKRRRGMIAEFLDASIEQAHKLHRTLCGKRNTLDAPLEAAERTIKSSIGTYEAEKRTKIEAARRAAEEEARRVAAEAEAARQKIIAEQRRIAEEKRIADAVALSEAGKTAEADAVLAAPVHVVVPPPVVSVPIAKPPAYQAPDSVTTRLNWKFRIVNAALIPREFMLPNEQAIGAHARTLKDKAVIPGVEFYAEASASLR